ncbi:MAG: hypothetical protein Q8K32_24125 [Archangium sp.]|nr:hypothetical protein [Archangium sp.]
MRSFQRVLLAIAVAALGGCTCADTVSRTRFACEASTDCLPGNACRGGECRADDIAEGSCFPGERQTCAVASCERPCGEDGGWASCAPASGPGFERNPLHCGECGRRCSDRLGDALTCIDSRCTCVADFDCPSGDVCMPGGVCVMNTDSCAKVTCAVGSVCRAGTCAPVPCADGCKAGEVCDEASSSCRLILPCRLAEPCGDGGICEGAPQPDGERCSDGVACTFADTCTAGACSGTPYACPAPDQCQQALACAGDGGCEVTPVADGTTCDDGVACTFNDQCTGGTCGGAAYTCMPNQCASTSVCAGDGGCDVTPRNVGTGCDDGVGCTFGDLCSPAGFCTGTSYSCPGVTACREAGLCLGDGGCDVVNKPDNTSCDDGLACSTGDTCSNGVCSGIPGTTYLDADNDGRGDLTMPQTLCPAPAGYVADGGDCNDSNAFVQDLLPAARDADQDGVTATTTLDPTACVGPPTTVNGRTYYRSSTGDYSWLASASAMADCNDADDDVFETRPMMVLDADRDGYSTGATLSACVGVSSVINGRTYYANTTGAFVYLDLSAAVGSGDCLDSDPDVFTSRPAALDADHDGFTTTTSTSTQCVGASSVINTRTYYNDTSGNPNWLGSASPTADCNDGNASITGPSSYYVDTDGDGFGAGAAIARCMPVAGEVSNNTDCDDSNGSIHTTRSVATDADQDSFTTTTTTASRCAGSSAVVNGRTYYRDAANALSLLAAASAAIDCNDADGSVFPQTYYLDGDGDGRGLTASPQVQCPRQTGWAATGGDCNDASAMVFQTVTVFDDTDQDGFTNGAATAVCVGSTSVVNGRTYYRSISGALPYITTSLGSDCNTSSGALFTSRNNMVPDDDRDGYPASVTDAPQCTGASSTLSGRTYYADGTGGYWMGRGDCIQTTGSNCSASFVDCYDLNSNARFGQTTYFVVHRGDGSFDYDCVGGTTANTTATYCASTTAGVTLFTDGACVTSSGTGATCDSPTPFALPGACGKFSEGAGTFTLQGVCTASTVPTTTQIGCR